MLSENVIGEALRGSRFSTKEMSSGLVPFGAVRVAWRLSELLGMSVERAMQELEAWAPTVGGEVREHEVLWLPAVRFDET